MGTVTTRKRNCEFISWVPSLLLTQFSCGYEGDLKGLAHISSPGLGTTDLILPLAVHQL